MKTSFVSLIIREIYIEAIVRYCFILINIATIKKFQQTKVTTFGENVEKSEPLFILVGMSNGAACVEENVVIAQKIKSRIILCSRHSISVLIPQIIARSVSKRYLFVLLFLLKYS